MTVAVTALIAFLIAYTAARSDSRAQHVEPRNPGQ
jgi:hypothetical protein